MIGTMNVVGISHLTHNQVVTGSSPAGPWRTWCTNVHSYIENANSPIFVDGDWTSWNSTTFTLSVIKDCDDIEDDRKNNFKKKKYIYLKP